MRSRGIWNQRHVFLLMSILLLGVLTLTAWLWMDHAWQEEAHGRAGGKLMTYARDYLSEARRLLQAAEEGGDAAALDLAILDVVVAERLVDVLRDLDPQRYEQWAQVKDWLGAEVYSRLRDLALKPWDDAERETLAEVGFLMELLAGIFPEEGEEAWNRIENVHLQQKLQAVEEYLTRPGG